DAHANLGLLTSEIGDATEAIEHLERAHQLRPDDLEFLVNLGVARTRVSAKQAADDFRRVLTLKADHFNARMNLAKMLSTKKRYDKTIPHYELALAQQPDDVGLRIALADALSETRDAEAAFPHYQAAIAATPTLAAAHLGLAHLYRRCGRFDDAYACFL